MTTPGEGSVVSAYLLGKVAEDPGDGVVHHATCQRTGAPCLVKLLMPRDLHHWTDGLVTAADVYRRTKHRSLLEVIEVHAPTPTEGGWVVTAFLPGESLYRVMPRGTLEASDIADVVARAAEGLAMLHDSGITFGWITPWDIMLTPSPVLTLPSQPSVRMGGKWVRFGSDSMMGNPVYASPELMTGGAVEPANDIYSLGLMLMELVTRDRPFVGESIHDNLSRKLAGLPRASSLRPDCPPWLDEVIARAVATRPGERYSSMGELRRDLLART